VTIDRNILAGLPAGAVSPGRAPIRSLIVALLGQVSRMTDQREL
jgi:hypothetical protein